jgi:hypothetical protein
MGLRVGGVVVPYWPSYWGGMGYPNDVTNHEGAGNDNNSGSDSGAGDGSSGAISG